jgi:hypothetical protein
MHFWYSTWNRIVIRVFGVLNMAFAAVGLYAVGETALSVTARGHDSAQQLCVREAYYVMTSVDSCCLVALVVGGIYLWRLRRRGLAISNIVFLTEIAWFLGTTALAMALGMSRESWWPFGMSIAGAGGIGGVGTAPQMLTGYPILAIVTLNLVRGGFPDGSLQRLAQSR